METRTQFSVYLINKPGVLASVTGELARQKVNIIALALMDAGEHGALRLVCDDPEATRKVLGKTHDRWTECEVVVLELDNRPGAFANVANKLSDEHINITYAYCSAGAPGGRTTAVFKVAPEDIKKVAKLLEGGNAKKSSRPVKRKPGR